MGGRCDMPSAGTGRATMLADIASGGGIRLLLGLSVSRLVQGAAVAPMTPA